MIKINPSYNDKQKKALKTLLSFDNGVSELLYGGAAGGGKSWLGCSWLIISCLMYPSSRWLMGRAKLLALKQTTFNTFLDVCKSYGLKQGIHFKVNGQTNIITWFNGSEIIMKDLFQYPSDRDFDSLGSLEITGAFIDEVNQVTVKAKNIVMSRIRYKLDEFCNKCGCQKKVKVIEYDKENNKPLIWECSKGHTTKGLTPKLFMSCNPAKNWVYNEFYKPFNDGTIQKHRLFIQALVEDNKKYISQHYIANLEKMDAVSKKRLRYGLWEYSDELSMFDFAEIQDTLNRKREVNGSRNFMACDLAGLGKDKTVVWIMSETMEILACKTFSKLQPKELMIELRKVQERYDVDDYDIAIDFDGLGFGFAAEFEVAERIRNGSAPIGTKDYQNLKTQLYFRLAELFNDQSLAFSFDLDDEIVEKLTQELQVLRREKVDMDGKICMTTKEDIKKQINRSPDYSDALAYLMIFFFEDNDNDEYLVIT